MLNCEYFSICLGESTDITHFARLAIFVRFCIGNKIIEELLDLESLHNNHWLGHMGHC